MRHRNARSKVTRFTGTKPPLDASGPGVDTFVRSIEQALEHCLDPAALEAVSPLAAPYFLGRAWPGATDRPGDRGRVLVELLRSARSQLDKDAQTLLNAAFFERDPHLQHSGIAMALHMSDRTYFRHKAEAIRDLAEKLVTAVLPTLRSDAPQIAQIWGRRREADVIKSRLEAGQTVYISGPCGIGKSSLAGAVVRGWPQAQTRVFWHTIHVGLTDQLSNLLFALAYFLRGNGALAAWRQVVADKGVGAIERVISSLRFDLAELRTNGVTVVLCFDEVDLLRPELESHAPMLDFLDDLRGKVAQLLMGQRQAIDADLHIALAGLNEQECSEWMRDAAPDLPMPEQRRFTSLARGNPAQLRLLLALRALSSGNADETTLLVGAPSMELLLGRVWRRLSPAEQLLAQQVAVLRSATPHSAWAPQQATLDLLIARGLLQNEGYGVQCAAFARELILRQIPAEIRPALHARAAELRGSLGECAEAAHHWLEAGQPALAIWLLFAQRVVEVERGNGAAMLALLNSIDASALNDKRDRELLFALRAQLGQLFGDALQAESDARAVGRQRAELLAYASEALGESLTKQGRIEQALTAYRNGLDALLSSPQYRSVRLRNKTAYLLEARLHRLAEARGEALGARLEAEIMAGSVEDRAGNYAEARARYEAALQLAGGTDGHLVERALLYACYGNLLWKQRELDAAQHWLLEALRLDQQRGDLQAEASQRINLSAVHIMAARYEDALAEARAGLAVAEPLGQPYFVAGLCSNAGEACCHLKRYDEALSFAHRSLGQEEESWRPYALTVVGMSENGLGRPANARQTLQGAVAAASEVDDAYAEAAALRALGDVERAEHAFVLARDAYERSLLLYERLALHAEREEVRELIHVLPSS